MLKFIHESDWFISQTLDTTYNCFFWFYDMISDQYSCVNEVKREKREPWHWCVWTPPISCPQVRCVTCTEGPLSRTVLFPKQPHPEHHEDDYFHPPHPTPPYPGALGCKPNMQILPVQTGRGTDIQIMPLLLSFLSFSLWSLHMLYIYYSWNWLRWSSFWHSDPHTHHLPQSVSHSPVFFPSLSAG